MVNFYAEDISFPSLDLKKVEKWIEQVVSSKNCSISELTVVFCSDKYILKVNQEYLNHDYYTDIITFDYCSDNIISGDLLISLDTVKTNAIKFDTEYPKELHRVIIHGILHLLGYKDKTEEEVKVMRQNEDEALSLIQTIA